MLETILKAVISLPLIFFIPGYLTYNVFLKETKNLEFFEAFFIQILVSILISGLIGLILAKLGCFSLFNLLILLTILAGTISLKCRMKLRLREFHRISCGARALKFDLKFFAFGIVILVAIALFFHPYPWILGYRDPGTYVNMGVNIAETGSIIIYDPILANLNESVKTFFFQSRTSPYDQGFQFSKGSGFFITDKTIGEVTPEFFYLWPTWIGIFYSIFGLRDGLYITPLFAIFAVLGIYLFGRIAFNRNVGLIGSTLLTLNFAQIWYARYPSTEVMAQFLIFSGLATFILFRRNLNKYIGVVSALCFGEALLIRIDSVLLLIPIFAFFIFLWFYDNLKKEHLYFIIPLALSIAFAALTAFFISTPYTFRFLRFRILFTPFITIFENKPILIGISMVLIVIITLIHRIRNELITKVSRMSKRIPHSFFMYTVALLLILLLCYAYFIRPTGHITSESYNLVKLSWYTAGFFGVFLATLGSILLLFKKPFSGSYFFFGIMLVYTAFFIQNALVYRDHPWWIRRFLPVVIPSFIIMMSYLLDKIGTIKATIRKVPIGRVLSTVLLLILVFSFGKVSSLLINHVEYEGAIEHTERIAEPIDDDGIVIGQKSYYFERIAVPLKYIHGKQIVCIQNISYEVTTQIREWTDDGEKVYALDLTEDLAFELYPYNEFILLDRVMVKWPLLVGTYGEFPDKTIQQNHTYSIYKLKPRSGDTINSEIDVGENDFGLLRGFHPPEICGETTFRWSKESAKIRFLIPENKRVQKLYLRIGGCRPFNVPSANVTLSINGQVIAKNFIVSGESYCGTCDMQVYEFNVLEEISGPEIVLEIETNAWIPILYGVSRDMRTLGIAVDWVMLELN